jgi:Uma2 family endonuclease
MALPLTRRRFTVEDYYQMAAAGILAENDRVELIDGEIVEMSPIGSRHAACVTRTDSLFAHTLGRAVIVRVQNPVRLDERSEPEPDVALLRPREDFYESAHPTAADVLLVVEVADTSLEYDCQVKAPLYARHGIPELWVANPGERHLITHREPTPGGYATVRVARPGEVVRPVAFPDLEIAVADILG